MSEITQPQKREQALEVVKDVLDRNGIDIPNLDETMSFSSVGIDSLDVLFLASTLDDEIGTEIPEATMKSWTTIGDVVNTYLALKHNT